MHATQVARPFHHDGWVYEEKVDGYRMVAVKADGHVRLISRAGRDHTKRFTVRALLVHDHIARASVGRSAPSRLARSGTCGPVATSPCARHLAQ